MARKQTRLKGVDQVLKNLNKEIMKIQGRSMKGLINAAIIIRRDMDTSPPLIPVMDGNLRASWFITTGTGAKNMTGSPAFNGDKAGAMSSDHRGVVGSASGKAAGKPLVIIGFSANYAGFVHERKGVKYWNRPGSGAGFLENAITRNRKTIIQEIKKSAKIK